MAVCPTGRVSTLLDPGLFFCPLLRPGVEVLLRVGWLGDECFLDVVMWIGGSVVIFDLLPLLVGCERDGGGDFVCVCG